jgi:hypothetical protein
MTKKNISWLVQSNLVLGDLVARMGGPARHYGLGLKPFEIDTSRLDAGLAAITVDPELKDEVLIPYGSTVLIRGFDQSGLRRDGFFYDQESLRTSRWVEHLGERMLNHDALFLTLGEAANHIGEKAGEGTWFVKPDADLKDFTGGLVNASTILAFRDKVASGACSFSVDIPVVAAKTKNTGWEYRLFMIEERVVAASSYRLRSMLDQSRRVPQDVIAYAEETARAWRPSDAYVMDVGETDAGLKVVEFNCLNASGLYACDERDVVREVSSFVSGRL